MLARQNSPWWQRALRQRKAKIDDRPRQNPAYGAVMQKGRQKEVLVMIKNAKPIWLDYEENNQYIQAVRSFDVKSTENAILQICADAEYAAYINGKLVGTGQFKSFPGKKFYDEYDISGFVKKGENTLSVVAYHQGQTTSAYYHDKANLSFAVIFENEAYLSDETTLVRPHPNYKSGEVELVTFQLGYIFDYNADGQEHPFRSTSLFKYDALMTKREKYIDRITDEIAQVWGAMLFSGATSLWETSDGADAFRDAGSLCHAWSAVPVYLFYKYYMGFEPTSPGFESFTLSPVATVRNISFETDLLTPVFSKRVKIDGENVCDCE